MGSKVHVVLDSELVQRLKKKYPEIQRLTATDVVDWALRKLLVGGK